MNKFVSFLAKVAKFVCRPFFPTKVYGDNNLPNKQCLVVSNHVSGWDPLLFTMYTKNIISFVYKAEFHDNAFLRWILDGLECVPVKRGEIDMSATKSILRLLKNDRSVYLFPEGTRNPNVDCLQEFHTGAALFAIKTRAPIRPVYIWDKARAFRRNYIIIGEEFTLDDFYDQPISRKMLEDATAVIKNKVDELRIQLNAILDAKGVKRRKRTKKELKQLEEFNAQQALLAQQQAEAVESADGATAQEDKNDGEDE